MTLNSLFTDGLVLQANQPIRVFGEGGGTAKVEFCGETVEQEFFGTTNWVMELQPRDYGGPYEMKITLDQRETVLRDVFVGDVFLIGGQSNMQFKMWEENTPEEYGNYPNLRLFSTTRPEGGEWFTPADGWVKASMETVGGFSAIGYLFGRERLQQTEHAIGLVTMYQGAAVIQCFLPPYVFEQNSEFILPFEARFDMQYPWNRELSVLYEFMLKKISPFSFGAVVWYQGESNCSEAESLLYHQFLHHLIASWRLELRDEKLPFVVIQIHDFLPRDTESWRRIQQAQAEASHREQFVRTVVTKDVCETDVIHPLRKMEVAHRVARAVSELLPRREEVG